MKRQDSLKIKINIQPGYINRKTIYFYILIFNNGLDEALLKFLILLKKIIKVQNLTMVTKCFGLTKNILTGDTLQFFEQKDQSIGNETMPI